MAEEIVSKFQYFVKRKICCLPHARQSICFRQQITQQLNQILPKEISVLKYPGINTPKMNITPEIANHVKCQVQGRAAVQRQQQRGCVTDLPSNSPSSTDELLLCVARAPAGCCTCPTGAPSTLGSRPTFFFSFLN